MVKTEKFDKRLKRKKRIRKKIFGTESVPRVSVFRSSKHIYASVIDDSKDRVIVGVSSLSPEIRESLKGLKKTDRSKKVGEFLAKVCIEKGIKKIVFDRNGFDYKGRVKSLASGAREGGLEF